ncbi:hypothetical protein ACLVWU_01030 [Bdellovibrio sp. HCB290]|uniref:hypothetical protein n=1 Tax=Bdellovibrio sp. HCB290 TaxID=3394356 RepID=UPI0039B401A8
MKLIYLISLALFGTSVASAHSATTPSQVTWGRHLAHDFIIGTPPAMKAAQNNTSALWSFPAADACEEHIAKAVCHVKSLEDESECRKAPAEVYENLRAVYQRLPVQFQKMMCKVSKIGVVDEMFSLAMAGFGGTDPASAEAFIAISTSLVAANPSADAVFGWKEQKVFGAKAPRYEVGKKGPRVSVRSKSPVATLEYVLIHELAHLFDFANGVNRYKCEPGPENFDCSKSPKTQDEFTEYHKHQFPIEDSWGVLSWKTAAAPNDNNSFPLHSKLCFYNCKESLQLSDMDEFYMQLDPTSFVSAYAATNPWDDFAESVAFYVMTRPETDLKFRISTGRAIYFNEWRWSQSKKKNNWIELFFEGDLKYPR